MKFLKYHLLLLGFCTFTCGFSQLTPTSDEALKQYQEISKAMNRAFPEGEMRTYSRESFSQSELETYLSQHFQRMDLLKFIKGQHILKLEAYFHSGNWFNLIGFPKESIKSFINFFDYFNEHEADLTDDQRNNFLIKRFVAHGLLAENYANLGMFQDAAQQHQTNIEFTKSLHNVFYPSAINNYGLFFYWHKKDLDSAMVQFKQAYELTIAGFPNHSLLGSIRDNIADIHVDQQNYREAQILYEMNFKFFKAVVNEETLKTDVPRLISAGSQLITTDVHLNKLQDAQIALNALEDIVKEESQKNNVNPKSRLEYLQAKEQLLYGQGKIEAAYDISKHLKHYGDSLREVADKADFKWQTEFNDVTLDRIALNFKINELQKETQIKSQRAKLWITGSISSVFIILLLFLVISRYQHLINSKNKQLIAEKNLENSQLKVNQLHSEIESKERDLSDFAINLIQNQEWANSLATKMEAYKAADPSEKKDLLNDLEQDIKNKITFDEDTRLFFERLDKLSDAFYSQLITNYPNLSKNETQLCSLIRLKMDSRSIATLQNITLASLNTSRYRLRKKLKLSDDVNLDDFIQGL